MTQLCEKYFTLSGMNEGYDIYAFQIICNTTGAMYELDLKGDKVIVVNGLTCN